ncbi:MAG: hypothetical protein QNJ97_03430 [Myxococcota bacterium]|nr:hypothetical protein [Myxococcota bacterium]
MGILKDKLMEDGIRPTLIADCVALVESEVASKKGVTGLMIKGGYKAFKAIKPKIVAEAVDHLLDDFVGVLDRHYDAYQEQHPDGSPPFDTYAVSRDTRIADDLLGITDDILNRSNKTALKKIYQGMRGVAERNVAQAVPGIGRLVQKHVAG